MNIEETIKEQFKNYINGKLKGDKLYESIKSQAESLNSKDKNNYLMNLLMYSIGQEQKNTKYKIIHNMILDLIKSE